MKRAILLGALALGLSGCVSAPQSLYEWGSYQKDLLRYSKNPGETKKFSDSLLVTIQKAETAHRVPPGLYAEYGYTLLDQGDVNGATSYFVKERDLWPESAELMNRLIGRLNKALAAAGGNAQ
jgi:hypothetical protein